MTLHAHVPSGALARFVKVMWISQSESSPHPKERLLPTGTVELVINLHRDRHQIFDRKDTKRVTQYSGSLICGVQSKYFVIDATEQQSLVGVHFRPGGAFGILGLPVNELTDSHVDLSDVLPAGARDLRERLLHVHTVRDRVAVLEQWMLERLLAAPARHPAVRHALRAFHLVPHVDTVAGVCADVGLSQRRFIDVFRQEVGLTPKLYCRVRRFQEVVHIVSARRQVEWARIAASCGYYDQAHFIHDFQSFSGLTPSAYVAGRTEHQNHVPLHE